MRKIFMVLVACVCVTFAMTHSAWAGNTDPCVSEACKVLKKGHVRGRIPVACVSIPFLKERYGEVAMFIMRDFNPSDTPAGIQEQLSHALFKDSKITGPVDDFCRNPKYFAGARWVVLCDEHHKGWITGKSLQYAIRYRHPAGNRRVIVGSHG